MIKIIDWLIKINTKNYASQFVSNGNAGSGNKIVYISIMVNEQRRNVDERGQTESRSALVFSTRTSLLFMQN